jgi:hypothetical protein
MQDFASNDRAEALQAAKMAVRAYARDPLSKNEAGVEEALRRIRRFDSVARWRGSRPPPRRRRSREEPCSRASP